MHTIADRRSIPPVPSAPSTSGRRRRALGLTFHPLIKIDLEANEKKRLSPEANRTHVFRVNSERFQPIPPVSRRKEYIHRFNVGCHEGYVHTCRYGTRRPLSIVLIQVANRQPPLSLRNILSTTSRGRR